MFRLEGMGELPAEEKARVKKGVQQNITTFVILCAAIRIGISEFYFEFFVVF